MTIDPFYLLGVERETDDESVRKAYLEKIRQWPPEHYPERFQKISEAYSLVQTRKKRLVFQLFHRGSADFAPVKGGFFSANTRGRPTQDELKGWLKKVL
ncbi:MAG TPA: DnaJ domain-containing protein, partial [Magnetococcales bacterium]|nr:DnaJ domain-containing protein [Magnetococcales bacterium]